MPLPAPSQVRSVRGRAGLRVTLSVCAAPLLWLLLLTTLYALGDRRCEWGAAPLAWLWALGSALALVPGALLLRQHRLHAQAGPARREERRFLIMLGLLLHLLSLLLCVGLAVPLLFLRPCQ